MPVLYQKFITRQDLRNNPNRFYLFGDNVLRKGYGGQAKEMRGEPNAIGVATKKRPYTDDESFFTDDEYEENKKIIDQDLAPAFRWVKLGGIVVIPEDGIGTGYSEMMPRCPKTFCYLNIQLHKLKKLGKQLNSK